EAGYILAAMEDSWGKAKALDYLGKLSKQDISYRRGGTLTTQVVTSGEYPIGIAITAKRRRPSATRERRWALEFYHRRSSNPTGCFWRKMRRTLTPRCCSLNGCSRTKRKLFWQRL